MRVVLLLALYALAPVLAMQKDLHCLTLPSGPSAAKLVFNRLVSLQHVLPAAKTLIPCFQLNWQQHYDHYPVTSSVLPSKSYPLWYL